MSLIITSIIAGAVGCLIGSLVGAWVVRQEREGWGLVVHGL